MREKSPSRISLVAIYLVLLSVLTVLLLSCGGGGGDEGADIQPVDVTGKWVGTFTSTDNINIYTVYIDITSQNGSNGEGTWSRDDQAGILRYGIARAQGYSRDGDTPIASFYLYTEDEVTCCDILGCITDVYAEFSMRGQFVNETVVSNVTYGDTYGSVACSFDFGKMIVERVEVY